MSKKLIVWLLWRLWPLSNLAKVNRGQQAELWARLWSRISGYKCIYQNWRCPFGEVDLILAKERELVFMEVKYRQNNSYGGVCSSLTPTQLARLKNCMEYYISVYPQPDNTDIRIDFMGWGRRGTAPLWLKGVE